MPSPFLRLDLTARIELSLGGMDNRKIHQTAPSFSLADPNIISNNPQLNIRSAIGDTKGLRVPEIS